MARTTLVSAGPLVDAHRQIALNSCSTSLAEMMLKVSGKVAPSYYELQKRDTPNGSGLELIRDKQIAGATFRVIPPGTDVATIIRKIHEELEVGKAVGAYLVGTSRYAHGWIIVDIEPDQIVMLSKRSEFGGGEGSITEEMGLMLLDAGILAFVDCIYLEP
jgi:hypothetical protein